MSRLPRTVSPYFDRGVLADAPHLGTQDASLAAQTQSLALRCSGTCRHWLAGQPGGTYITGGTTISITTAPVAVIDTLDTWFTFSVDAYDTAAQYPWRFTEAHKSIRVDITLACMHAVQLSFRCGSAQLCDAYTTDSGTACPPHQCTQMPRPVQWQRASQASKDAMRIGRFTSWITPDNLPSNRRVVLVPAVKVKQTHYDLFNLAAPGNVRVWIVDMSAIDVADSEEIGL